MKNQDKLKMRFSSENGIFGVWRGGIGHRFEPSQCGYRTSERSVVTLFAARCASTDGRKQVTQRHLAAQRSIGCPQTNAPLCCNGASVVLQWSIRYVAMEHPLCYNGASVMLERSVHCRLASLYRPSARHQPACSLKIRRRQARHQEFSKYAPLLI